MTLVAYVVCVCSYAATDNAAYEAELNKAYNLQHPEQTMLSMMESSLAPLVENGMLTAEKCQAMSREMVEMLMPKVEEITKQAWRETFTYDELQQLVAWLSSATGQKLLSLSSRSSSEMQKLLQQPEFQQMMMQVVTKYMQ